MLCAESNMPLVGRQERNGEVLSQSTVDGLYSIDLVLVVCVSQAIVAGEPTSEFACELGLKGDESRVVRLFNILSHHPGIGVSKRRINTYSDFGGPKTFADAAIELSDGDIVSTSDKLGKNTVADKQLVLHQGLIVLLVFDRKVGKERGDGVSVAQSDESRTLPHAFCGWLLKGEVSEIGHDDGLRVTAWCDWLEAVIEISGDVGLGRELVTDIDHRRDGQ